MTATASQAPIPPATPPGKGEARVGQQFLQLLCRRGLLTPEQIQAASEVQRLRSPGKSVAEVLVEQGVVSWRDVVAARATSLGVPFAVLQPRMVNPEALKTLPLDYCDKQNILPMSNTDGWLTLAVEDFGNLHLIEEIRRRTGLQLQVLAATAENIRQVRETVMGSTDARSSSAPPSAEDSARVQNELEELTVLSSPSDAEQEAGELESAAAGSPIVKLVNHIIRAAVTVGASDIHIEPDEGEFRIRYRVDGELMPEQVRPAMRLLPAVVSRIKIIAGLDISERRLPQDGRVAVMTGGVPVELRVSTMATPAGEKVVMRIVDRRSGVSRLDDLGFAPMVLDTFRSILREPHGMILVTGPTGSGKSTTLYAALAEIQNDRLNISTIEDPVERKVKGVNQFQVNNKAGFTFARALRSMLRQDPDIVMVGEVRDAETAKLATEAALTGHLVFSTLHTNDAPSAVPRLVNMGVEPYLVAASLRAVLAQRLVGRLCQHCKQEYALGPSTTEALARLLDEAPPAKAFRGSGCSRCRFTGFSGRVSVHELLVLREDAFDNFGAQLTYQNVRQIARSAGYRPLFRDCLEKALAGMVGIEAVMDLASAGGSSSALEASSSPGPAPSIHGAS